MKKILLAFVAALSTLSVFASAQTKEVRVKTARQFIEALGTDTHIIVENDILDLTHEIEKMKSEGKLQKKKEDVNGVFYTDEYDGPSLIVSRVMNLTIEGIKPGTHIQVTPRYANVLAFINCQDINIKNLRLGHTDAGDCIGDVINLTFCQDVNISQCKLYGCGVIGLDMTKCESVHITDSEIYECSQTFIYANGVKGFNAENCSFYNNGNGMSFGESSDVLFSNCTIKDNHGELFHAESRIRIEDCKIDHREGPGNDKLVEIKGGKVVINYDNAGELPDYSEEHSLYAYSRENYPHNYEDLRYWEDVLYFSDEDRAFYYNDPWGWAMDYVASNNNDEAANEEIAISVLSEPQDFKVTELLAFKKVKSFMIDDDGIHTEATVPCRFQREDNTMNFDKLGGAKHKWGVLFRKDDRHVMFAGCSYIAGAKKTFFNDKNLLTNGMMKKTTDGKFVMMFVGEENGVDILEIYIIEK